MRFQETYADGQRQALAYLVAWKQLGYASREGCRIQLHAVVREELAEALAKKNQVHIAFCRGWLAVLSQ